MSWKSEEMGCECVRGGQNIRFLLKLFLNNLMVVWLLSLVFDRIRLAAAAADGGRSR